MSVTAIGAYEAQPLDRRENFHGLQLVYFAWNRHLMFCSPMTFPLAPGLSFADFLEQVVRPAIAAHPDAARVDFAKAQWLLDDQPFSPDPAASLEGNGIGHKSLLHLTTPGLNGLGGSCN